MNGVQELRSERGQTTVELALVLPLLCMLLFGVIQFGVLFNNYETLTDAARAGARQAILLRLSGGAPSVGVQAVRDAASSLDQSNLNVTVTDPDWTTAGTNVTVTATYPYSIGLLGLVVASGNLSSTQVERLE
jgi:Flp pilus assembly protein TadG